MCGNLICGDSQTHMVLLPLNLVTTALNSTSCVGALSFPLDRGHCGTQMASLESQPRQGVLNLTVALRIGGDLEEGF